ncbi:MAG: UDP-N-acetylmuramoyl-tripeptide--D-alanyl-D-alanine ligase [Deltaproteobacteria bacterium]|nr:UDP-N-acetylmuramoyl-tripeptide--D-alanyl-D-alanine ligase [Deltaproteobacteria bacterium]
MGAQWEQIRAGEILTAIEGEWSAGSPETIISRVSTDSRNIGEGSLFWALEGERFDGHDYAEQAVEKGAAGVVVRQGYEGLSGIEKQPVVIVVQDTLKALGDLASWWRHQHHVAVAAITGSAGKTTTKEMTAEILAIGSRTLKNQGNFNNLVGLPLTLFSLDEGHRRAVLEMGMNHPGEIGRLTEIADPDVGLITNVAKAHLEGVGSIEGVARAKLELMEKASPGSRIILNGDDALLMKTASGFGKKAITFGMGEGNDIRAEGVKTLGRDGIIFNLCYQGDTTQVRLRVPGLQNVFNALAAASIALCLDESRKDILQGLDRFQGIEGRFAVSSLPGGATLVDDTYNANPASLKVALDSLEHLIARGGKIIVGLGEMLELGEETIPAHIEAGGMVAGLGAAHLLAMGEHAPEMIEGALEKGLPAERAVRVHTHEDMVNRIRDLMEGRDLIFLKGSRRIGLDKVAEGLRAKQGG